jgi:ADP-heptose:LPS heptosyltransferase
MTISVNTMRKIDKYIGIPICLLLSLIDFLLKKLSYFFKKTRNLSPKNLLFIELSEMGSAILVDPILNEAKKRGCNIYFLIFSSNKKSLTLLNTVPDTNIITINSSSIFNLILDTFIFVLKARKFKIDTVIDLELFSRFTAILSYLSFATIRVGFDVFHGEGLWRGNFITKKVIFNPYLHITQNFYSLLYSAFNDDELPNSKVYISKEFVIKKAVILNKDKNKMALLLKENFKKINISLSNKNYYILINANASDLLPQRRWPKKYFSDLIKKIVKLYPDALIVMTGASNEFDYAQDIIDSSNSKKVINFCGESDFNQLPSLYVLSKLLISNDSGPSHFASTTNIKTIILYGPETPKLYGSLGNSTHIYANLACSPCVSAFNHRNTPCIDNQCMKQISVEEVLDKVKLILR